LPPLKSTIPWLQLFRFRETWGVVLANFSPTQAGTFYLFWLPKYLYDARGFDVKAVGTFAWIPPSQPDRLLCARRRFKLAACHHGVSVNRRAQIVLAPPPL